MNRWATRHRPTLEIGLEPDEQLLTAERAVIAGRSRPRIEVPAARTAGFPVPGPLFVLGLSTQRLVWWRSSTLMAHPRALVDGIPLKEVAAITLVSRFRARRLAVLLEAGPLLVVKPLWGRGLEELAAVFAEAR